MEVESNKIIFVALYTMSDSVQSHSKGFRFIRCLVKPVITGRVSLVIVESLSHQASIQGESDTEPDGLIQSITNKLGGIFSDDDSSEDADISDTDDNDELFDPSLDKPVFLTPKGPMKVGRGKALVVLRGMLIRMCVVLLTT